MNGKKKMSQGLAICLLLVLSVSIVLLVEGRRPSQPADYIGAIVVGLFFGLGVMVLSRLLEALAKGLDLSPPAYFLPWIFTGILVLYVLALLDAKREPWSLWEIREYSNSERFEKIARYADYRACEDEAHRRLDEHMESYRTVAERRKSKAFHIHEGNTIFELRQPLGKFAEKWKSRYVAKLENRKDLTEDEKQRMADEVYGPEIQSTLSLVCLPTIREKYWPPPFDRPERFAAATLVDIGKAELSARARKHVPR